MRLACGQVWLRGKSIVSSNSEKDQAGPCHGVFLGTACCPILRCMEPHVFGPAMSAAALEGDWLEFIGCKIEIDLMQLLAEF